MSDLVEMPKECLEAFITISLIGAAKGYSPTSWEKESILRHVGKVVGHIGKWMTFSTEEDHLLHAMWRLCAAVALLIRHRNRSGKNYKPDLSLS